MNEFVSDLYNFCQNQDDNFCDDLALDAIQVYFYGLLSRGHFVEVQAALDELDVGRLSSSVVFSIFCKIRRCPFVRRREFSLRAHGRISDLKGRVYADNLMRAI